MAVSRAAQNLFNHSDFLLYFLLIVRTATGGKKMSENDENKKKNDENEKKKKQKKQSFSDLRDLLKIITNNAGTIGSFFALVVALFGGYLWLASEFTFYYDSDKDGYGSAEKTKFKISSEPPPGYSHNPDDCDDKNSRAFPDAKQYQTRPRADSTFDYNCDDEETKEHKEAGRCVPNGVVKGWLGKIPECGKESDWVIFCDKRGGKSEEISEKKIQACR